MSKLFIGLRAILVIVGSVGYLASVNAQLSTAKNFVFTGVPKVPGITSLANFNALSSDKKSISIEYIDGLGRSQQKIAVDGIALGTDLVSPMEYDNLGRVVKQYLPYARPVSGSSGSFDASWSTNQLSFYQNNNPATLPNDLPDNNPFSITDYEPSPLNRVSKAFAPGNAWAGTRNTATEVAVLSDYKVYNTATDLVKTWEYNNTAASSIPVISTAYIYQTGDLIKTVLTDEQGKKSEEYKDKSGNLILKKVQLSNTPGTPDQHDGWLCTYYIYDNLDRLCYVLPPKAVEWLRNNNWVLTQSIIDELCFWYQYDNRSRLITKHIPGALPVNIVYDDRDRVVFTQDPNMKNQQKWMMTLYDFLNRPIVTAFWPSSLSRTTLQSNVDAETGLGNEMVTILGDQFEISYKPTFVSIGSLDILTVSVYDSYNSTVNTGSFAFDPNFTLPYTPGTIIASGDYAEGAVPNNLNAKGLLTGTKAKVLDPNGTLPNPAYAGTSHFYDDKNREIQTRKEDYSYNSYMGGGATTTVTTQYDFSGKALGTFQYCMTGMIYIVTRNELDINGRITKIYKGVNLNTAPSANKLVVTNEFDQLGRLKTKTVGTGTICENKEDYTYNIRGWTRGANLNYLNGNILNTNQRFFGYELAYNVMSPGVLATGATFPNPRLNGDIGSMVWASAGKAGRDAQGIWSPSTSGIMRKYDYTYDNTYRFKKADFTEFKYFAWINSEKDFSVTGNDNGVAYDANGNILSMHQKSVNGTSLGLIDVLSYTYKNSGISNKLDAVNDASATNGHFSQLGDFHKNDPYGVLGTTANDYAYDDNGNLTLDNNKGLNQVTYNFLNLPSVISVQRLPLYPSQNPKGTIAYVYDAAGNKLQKTVTEFPVTGSGSTQTITSYWGNIQSSFYGGGITQIGFEEGRIRWAYNTATQTREFKYDWFVKDHLGNVRMVLTEEPAPSPLRYLATFEDQPTPKVDKHQIDMEKELYGEEVLAPARNGLPEELKDKDPGNQRAALLRPGTTKVPYKIVRASAGDKFSIAVQYFYRKTSYKRRRGKETRDDIFKHVLANILSLGTGTNVEVKPGVSNIGSIDPASGVNPDEWRRFTDRNNENDNKGHHPRAYLNYVLLDTAMQFIKGGALRVGGQKDEWQDLAQTDIQATKDGYFLVYLSNEEEPSADKNEGPVFFDNLVLVTNEGPVMEENHYYPFGLLIQPICSGGTGKLENKYKFNGYEQQSNEFSDGSGLEWYDYKNRFYDNQIGRFFAQDGLADKYAYYSPYQFAGNEVPNAIDMDGLEPFRNALNWMGKFAIGFGKSIAGYTDNLPMGMQSFTLSTFNQHAWYNEYTGVSKVNREKAVQYRANPLLMLKDAGNTVVSGFKNLYDNITSGDPERMGRGFGSLAMMAADIAVTKNILPGSSGVAAGEIGLARGAVSETLELGSNIGRRMANVRALGNLGEDAVEVGAKTRIESLTGTAKYRVPDILTSTTLEEVKNVQHLSLTSQLRDFSLYSQQNGLQMILHTRATTTFSGPLQSLIDNGSILVRQIQFR